MIWRTLMLCALSAPPGELTIEEAIARARTESEAARIEDQRTIAAEARVDQAKAFFFPDVTLTGSYIRRLFETVRTVGNEVVTIQDVNALQANLALNQTLLDLRAFPAWRAAQAEQRAANLLADEAKRKIAYDAAVAFLEARSAEQLLSAADRRVDLARQNYAGAKGRAEAGLTSSNDVTRAELEVATAERDRVAARASLVNARANLGFLIRARVDGPLGEPIALLRAATATPAKTRDALTDEASAQRRSLAAAVEHAASLELLADAAQLGLVPSLELSGLLRATNEAGLSGRNVDGQIGVTLTWIPWNGGLREAEEAERRAEARIAELTEESDRRHVGLEVEQALANFESERARARSGETEVRVAAKNAAETAELYRRGLTTALAMADAALRLYEAEASFAQAKYGAAAALLGLRSAAGLEPLEGGSP